MFQIRSSKANKAEKLLKDIVSFELMFKHFPEQYEAKDMLEALLEIGLILHNAIMESWLESRDL